jgi:predicted adenylyl cyclase CyaB
MKFIEIEIKLKLDNPETLMAWLKKNAELVKDYSHTDYYFDPPHKTFAYTNPEDQTKDADEWFRIRTSEKGNEICYKLWHRDPESGRSLYADEIETFIGDKEAALKIITLLGFKETSVIKKHRKSYSYKEFQFDCDNVDDLGFFVEVEFKGEVEDPVEGKHRIYSMLKEIGLNDWKKTKRGYSWIQWNPESNHYEEGF